MAMMMNGGGKEEKHLYRKFTFLIIFYHHFRLPTRGGKKALNSNRLHCTSIHNICAELFQKAAC